MNPIEPLGVGFFGKLPALGDFVSRRLPRHFIEPWDQWLQASMRSSQELLGDEWLSLFLVSPIWRFAVSPGVCGPSGWAGVVMPSVDRVGRYYPLTLAQELATEAMLPLFLPEANWFGQLEAAALSVLDQGFDLERFDTRLFELGSATNATSPYFQSITATDVGQPGGKLGFRFDLDGLGYSDLLFPRLSLSLIERFLPGYSLWASEGVQFSRPTFLCCEGLPPIDAYADFLKGVPQGGKSWQVKAYQQIRDRQKPMVYPVQHPEPVNSVSNSDAVLPRWRSYGLSVVGNKRSHNEDALLDCPRHGMWVVADGMGGHQSGDFASRLVVDTLSALTAPPADLDRHIESVCAELVKINGDLCQYALGIQHGSIVGTTVVTLLAKDAECAVIWAGDSRLYRLRYGKFEQITRDHTLIDELMDSGVISRELATQQISANVITRAVGGQQQLTLDVIRFRAELGDRYLLCSDGLDKELVESEIATLMRAGSCQSVAEALIDKALSRSGRDNITVIVAEFDRRN